MYYKAFKRGTSEGTYRSKCGPVDIEYKVGQTYTIKGDNPLVLCEHGYHACSIAVNCWTKLYGYDFSEDYLGIVEFGVDTISDCRKTAGRSMTIVKILTPEEKSAACTGILLSYSTRTEFVNVDAILPTHCAVSQYWYRDGLLHRDNDLPAITLNHGMGMYWYRDGVLHRDNGKPVSVTDYGVTLIRYRW
jgi:hypothetical protein